MIRSSWGRRLIALLAVLLVAAVGRAADADTSLAGNWKFKDVSNGNDVTLAIVQIEVKDGKATASVLSAPLLGSDIKLEEVKVSGGSIHFAFKVPVGNAVVNAAAPKGEEKPKTLKGTIQLGSRLIFSEMERTDLKEISRQDAVKQGDAAQDLLQARFVIQDEKEKEKILKKVLDKNGDNAAGLAAAELLLGMKAKEGAKDDELRPLADAMLKVSKSYGPLAEKNTILDVARALTRPEKPSPLAVEFARKAEKGLTKDDTAEYSASVLKTLVSALTKSGKAADAKEVAATLAKLEKQLDQEFEKNAIPFKPKAPDARKSPSKRVAVVELFTGAQCPPCVSADIAFDAAAKTYKPADVVLLEYHLHIPGPDPLTNADTEGRQKFYGNAIRGTPTAFVSGKVTTPLGGGKPQGEASYEKLSKAIDDALGEEEQATIKLTANRKGDTIEASADVSDLKKTGEKVRLRFVLIEDVARYPGSNGQRLHHHVVRALPGGLDGTELKEAKATQKVTVNLADLRKTLNEYLTSADKKRPFADDDRPMEFKHLKVIALIQDDESKEILQAAQVDVPEEK
jgi:hypothetical protein